MVRNPSTLTTYMAHRAALVSYARTIVGDATHAEDVVQEAWLRFDELLRQKPPEKPAAYLYRIVRNLAIDRRRRSRTEARHIEPGQQAAALQVAHDAASPESAAIAREELGRFAEAWARLPERTRIVLEMRRFGGCGLQEIADHLGISVTSVHRIIATGIAQCRRHMRSRARSAP